MTVRVQFFSRLRDLAGEPKTVDLPAGSTLRDLLAQLYAAQPALAEWDAHLLLAIGLEFASRDHPLADGDLVSLMPPVQGG